VSWIASIDRRKLTVSDCSKRDRGKLPTTYKTRSATGGLGDSETVFQHLKANNFGIGDCEHDREVRFDDLAGSLKFGLKRAKDHGSIGPDQNVEDVKAMRSIMARESLTKSVIAALPDFCPIQGRTPMSPAIFQSKLSLNNSALRSVRRRCPCGPETPVLGEGYRSGSWARYGSVNGGEISEVGKPGFTDCSEGRKEGVKPFDHGGMGEDRVTESGRRHSRNHECLHGSNHLTGLGSQNSASKDSVSRLFDCSLQKPIHLAGGSCPRHREGSDRDLKNLNL